MGVAIPLSKGKVAIVDEADAERVQSLRWHYSDSGLGKGYARAYAQIDGQWRNVYMHRFLTGADKGQEVDHINGDTLDNRRCNLRVCSHTENMRNTPVRKSNPLGLKGIHYRKDRGVYQAYINVNGKRKRLGNFRKLEDAVEAYSNASRQYHGEFGRENQAANSGK